MPRSVKDVKPLPESQEEVAKARGCVKPKKTQRKNRRSKKASRTEAKDETSAARSAISDNSRPGGHGAASWDRRVPAFTALTESALSPAWRLS